MSQRGSRFLLIATGLFVFAWAVARACLQSISIDEAETYLVFVKRGWGFVWSPASNNHVLNTLLIRLLVSALGASQLVVRVPALLGAAVYIFGAYLFATMIGRKWIVQWPVFACLILNPLILDYFVAARGYSLATGFLLLALAIAARNRLRRGDSARSPRWKTCAISSVCLGLSFAGQFSFAFADAAAALMIFLWMRLPGRSRAGEVRESMLAIGTALVVPGLTVALLLAWYPVLHWPGGQLEHGIRSPLESLQGVYDASLYQVDARRVPQQLYRVLLAVKMVVLPVLAGLCLLQLAIVFAKPVRAGNYARWLKWVGVVTASMIAIALSAYVVTFYLFHLPLPKDRMILYLVPLATLLAASIVARPARGGFGRTVQGASVAALFVLATYYAFCLRLGYFREWPWDADVKDAYRVVAEFNHQCSITSALADGLFSGPLNFYRSLSGRESLSEFDVAPCCIPGKELYVVSSVLHANFVAANHLLIVYRGRRGFLAVALDRDAAARIGFSGCYPKVDWWRLLAAADPSPPTAPDLTAVPPGAYDDTDQRIRYSGAWQLDRQFREPAGGSITYSATPGDSLRIAFYGREVTLVCTKAFNRGKAEVFIDGDRKATIDLYSRVLTWRTRQSFGGLPPQKHVVEVRVARDRNRKATDGYVDLDQIIID